MKVIQCYLQLIPSNWDEFFYSHVLLIRSNKYPIHFLNSSCFEYFGTRIRRRSCRYDVVDEDYCFWE